MAQENRDILVTSVQELAGVCDKWGYGENGDAFTHFGMIFRYLMSKIGEKSYSDNDTQKLIDINQKTQTGIIIAKDSDNQSVINYLNGLVNILWTLI